METDLSRYCALVVDDEPLPRAHLAHLLKEAGVGQVHEARQGTECLALLEMQTVRPDWIFLDVRMPGLDGIAIADALNARADLPDSATKPPAVVFVTGYDEYAVQAFERAAADYLLKPVERDRLTVTLRRLAARSEGGASNVSNAPAAPHAPFPLPSLPLQRLPIRTNYAIRLLDLNEILAAVAREKRVEILTVDAAYPTYYTLSQLEQRLPHDRFLRVHESWIVNLAEILEIHNLGSQSYQLRLRSSDRLIPVSRRRLHQLQERLGIVHSLP